MKHIYLFVCCMLTSDNTLIVTFYLLLCIQPVNAETIEPCHLDGRWFGNFCMLHFVLHAIILDQQFNERYDLRAQ